MNYPQLESSLSPELRLFVSQVKTLPTGPHAYEEFDKILATWLIFETYLRFCYASDAQNPAVAQLYAGLLAVFTLPSAFRKVCGRAYNPARLHLFPLPPTQRLPDGSAAIVDNIGQFQRNFDLFTHGVLAHLDWHNIFAAGGSVTACLKERDISANDATTGKWLPGSDVDLFLWGLTQSEVRRASHLLFLLNKCSKAEIKIKHVYQAIKQALHDDLIACVRTKFTISFHCESVHGQMPTLNCTVFSTLS